MILKNVTHQETGSLKRRWKVRSQIAELFMQTCSSLSEGSLWLFMQRTYSHCFFSNTVAYLGGGVRMVLRISLAWDEGAHGVWGTKANVHLRNSRLFHWFVPFFEELLPPSLKIALTAPATGSFFG